MLTFSLVSITFRLSALSAPKIASKWEKLSEFVSQLPFGSVPFRHQGRIQDRYVAGHHGLNYLSAQCPFGTSATRSRSTSRPGTVSITFRLSALSARVLELNGIDRLSCGLNYLSAQCPFGTIVDPIAPAGGTVDVSITFRLSALSARSSTRGGRGNGEIVSITFRLSALSAHLRV